MKSLVGDMVARLALLVAVGCAVLCSAGSALAGEGRFRYHYIPLDPLVPPGFRPYYPVKVTDDERVYGTAIACGSAGCHLNCTPWVRHGNQGQLPMIEIEDGNITTRSTGSVAPYSPGGR
jgi:hypothetical protein